MSALKHQTFKQKLWTIIFVSFVARVITLILLPNKPASFGPDEGTYASFAKWYSEGKDVNDFPAFGSRLLYSGRSLIYPASLLIRFGINELDAVRIISSTYGLACLIVFAIFCLKLFTMQYNERENTKQAEKHYLTAVFLYAFFPSHFLWSNLGLRESASEFWLLICFLIYFKLHSTATKKVIFHVFIFVTSLPLLFASRPQLGWLVSITLIVSLIFWKFTRQTLLILLVIFAGSFAGYILTSDNQQLKTNSYRITAVADITGQLNVESVPQDLLRKLEATCQNQQKNQIQFEGFEVACQKNQDWILANKTKGVLTSATSEIEKLPWHQESNQVGASSQIHVIGCPFNSDSKVGKVSCIFWRAPYMAFTFMFRPLIFIDVTSLSSLLASIENLLWLLLVGLVIYILFQNFRWISKRLLGVPVIYLILYSFGAGSYEGNMGTAFRHKSLSLWAILSLIVMIFSSKFLYLEEVGNKPTESAV